MFNKAIIFLALIGYTAAVYYDSCKGSNAYSRILGPRDKQYVFSGNQPLNYTSQLDCRWSTSCLAGYNAWMRCPVMNLPQDCSGDRIVVQGGATALPRRYCGNESIITTSLFNQITVSFKSAVSTKGGRFLCEVICMPASRKNDIIKARMN